MEILSPLAIGISGLAVWYTKNIARDTQKKFKLDFRSKLTENIKYLKYEIMDFNEIMKNSNIDVFLEKGRDKLLYQLYETNKNLYLDNIERKRLSDLDEEFDDYVGYIKSNQKHDNTFKDSLQYFLKEFK